MRLPKRLHPGDKVGILAPAGVLTSDGIDRLHRSMDYLIKRGYQIEVAPNIFARDGYLAGADDLRLNDLLCMVQREDIAGVFCARGGYGSQRLIEKIYPNLKGYPPKVFVGYSDITALHLMLQKLGWVSFLGPMATEWDESSIESSYSADYLFSLLEGVPYSSLSIPPETAPWIICEGKATGRLVGGNLSIISALLGTAFEIDTEGAILFIEEVGESPYRIDRMLSSLKLAGKLQGVNGVLLGEFTRCHPAEQQYDKDVQEVLYEYFADVNKPVLAGFPSGHGVYNLSLPLGLEVTLDTDKKGLLIEGAVVI